MMKMHDENGDEILIVTRNPATGGFCCSFKFKGQKWYADLSMIRGFGIMPDFPECMIFREDKDGEVRNGRDYYASRDVTFDKESLLKCIEDFKREPEENDE